MAETFVIVGAGLAATEAAAAIKETSASAHVVIVGDEPHPFYTRIRLPELAAGKVDLERLVLKKPTWYEERSIRLVLETTVTSIEPTKRLAHLSDGSSLEWDKVLLATGARCFVPPVPGMDHPRVVAVRTADDTVFLRDHCDEQTKVVAIGGGLLGLEMAAALAGRGCQVTVVEVFDWLLPRQLDPAGGETLRSLLEEKGLSFRTGATVKRLLENDSHLSVALESGEELSADVVVVSAGIRPRTELAHAAGCSIDKGILVDDTMATSTEGVYAAGDCIEHRGRLYGIWPAAEQQGRIAGYAMAGKEVSYTGTIPSNRLKVTGIDVLSMGDHDPEGTHDSEVSRGSGSYRKLVRNDKGQLVGAVLVGDVSGHKELMNELESS